MSLPEIKPQKLDVELPSVNEFLDLQGMNQKFSLITKYKNVEEWAKIENDPVKCFYQGMKEIPNEEGEMVTCGLFAAEDGVFLSGQMILMEAVKNLSPGTPIQITYLGKKKIKILRVAPIYLTFNY